MFQRDVKPKQTNKPGLLCSAAWPSLLKKHSNGLINTIDECRLYLFSLRCTDFFRQLSDHSNNVNRQKLGQLLFDLMQVRHAVTTAVQPKQSAAGQLFIHCFHINKDTYNLTRYTIGILTLILHGHTSFVIFSRQASLTRQAFLITSLRGSRSKTGKKIMLKK